MSTADGRELGPVLEAHRFDEASLATYLVAVIPGFGSDIRVRQFLGGQSNPTFLIESSSGAYVLRKKPSGELLPSAHAVDREFRVISALANSNVPVPAAHVLCDDESVIGQAFYVMENCQGRVFSRSSLAECTPAERHDMYHHMARVFGDLHSVDYGAAGLEDFGWPTGYVARQISRWSKQYEASKTEEFEAHGVSLLAITPDPDSCSDVRRCDFLSDIAAVGVSPTDVLLAASCYKFESPRSLGCSRITSPMAARREGT